MNSAKSVHYELFGVNKRMADIERISHSIDNQLHFCRNSSLTNGNCLVVLYPWGHVCYYTWPEIKLLNVDILSALSEFSLLGLKKMLLSSFNPNNYVYADTIRFTGFDYAD